MDIKPIKTEADYEAVLEEIDRLMDARPDTPEGDRLDVLTTLVEAWEQKYHRIEDPDPIEAILHRMVALDLTRKRPRAADRQPCTRLRGAFAQAPPHHQHDPEAQRGNTHSSGGADSPL